MSYMSEYYHKARQAYMKDKVCVVCGTKDNLEIHHKNPDTKVKHVIWFLSYSERTKELSECEVRCKLCHDAIRRNAHQYGETNVNSKLIVQQIKEIRFKHGLGFSQKEIAQQYSVSRECIRDVVNNKTWPAVERQGCLMRPRKEDH